MNDIRTDKKPRACIVCGQVKPAIKFRRSPLRCNDCEPKGYRPCKHKPPSRPMRKANRPIETIAIEKNRALIDRYNHGTR